MSTAKALTLIAASALALFLVIFGSIVVWARVTDDTPPECDTIEDFQDRVDAALEDECR